MKKRLIMNDQVRVKSETMQLMSKHLNAGVHPQLIVDMMQQVLNQGLYDVIIDPVTGMHTTSIHRPRRPA